MKPDKHLEGYAKIIVYVDGKAKTFRAHRYSYQVFVGEIPEGLLVCHTCDVRHCVNPEHLWLGTNQDNVDDMVKKNRNHKPFKTHCIRGHELSGNNVRIENGRRRCKECERIRESKRIRSRKYREKKQAVA